ncbi:hypothetical protein L3081_24435 [Colwellia sp. MSW7]|jgi:hypothetical protein|uniref:Uncharacterized protein n=1 Tax=Colwellia maritima TaxID=2912588 RepID=A0ABS9X6W3_9GAMM|nr:hypothetical protein [Colwellia maritima]MCI2285978.1 hypothetical protein [Colwellia maritima]
MWFITTGHNKVRFYLPNGSTVLVNKIEWINEIKTEKMEYYSSEPFVKDPQQAISALYEAGVKGYSTKLKAKEFAKTLPIGTWKYLQLK